MTAYKSLSKTEGLLAVHEGETNDSDTSITSHASDEQKLNDPKVVQ